MKPIPHGDGVFAIEHDLSGKPYSVCAIGGSVNLKVARDRSAHNSPRRSGQRAVQAEAADLRGAIDPWALATQHPESAEVDRALALLQFGRFKDQSLTVTNDRQIDNFEIFQPILVKSASLKDELQAVVEPLNFEIAVHNRAVSSIRITPVERSIGNFQRLNIDILDFFEQRVG